MKQLSAILLFSLCWLVGCSATRAEPFGKLSGTNDLVLNGDLLFIVSTTTDELRVLDVSKPSPDFLRGPNPLEPLTIPVLDQPKSIFREWRFDGSTLGGNYVYVSSPGASEVSIVSVTKRREVFRLKTPAPVTTLAAAGGDVSEAVLFIATFDGVSSSVHRISIPNVEQVSSLSSDLLETLVSFDQEAIVSMQTLPMGELAVATRSQSGKGGRTMILNLGALPSGPRMMQFPSPVSFLMTYGPGNRLFGVLDEGSCSDNSCRGILAVEVSSGELSLDVKGAPMLPIRQGSGLFRGLSIAPAMTGPGGVQQQILGAATTSQGELLYFDAGALRHIDANVSGPSVVSTVFRTAPSPDGAEGVVSNSIVGGPVEVVLTDGATRQETVTLTFEGIIPGLQKLPVGTSDGTRFVLPQEYADRVRVGDFLVVESDGVICSETLVSSAGTDFVESSQKVLEDCLNGTTFTLRAGAGASLVVSGSETGYMGRTGVGDTFTFEGDYFHHSDSFDVLAVQPQLKFKVVSLEPQVSRDSRYEISLDDGFTAQTSFPDSNRLGTRFNLPGSVELDAVRQRVYVAYPSADAVGISQPATTPVGVNGSIDVRR